jgi:hypothetical protein
MDITLFLEPDMFVSLQSRLFVIPLECAMHGHYQFKNSKATGILRRRLASLQRASLDLWVGEKYSTPSLMTYA